MRADSHRIFRRLEYYNIYGNDLLGKLDSLGKRYYYLTDHLGSVRVTVKDTAGVPVDSWSDYYPFGKTSRSSVSSNSPKEQYNGKQRDYETGIDYYGMRYYNTEIARFITVDPLTQSFPELTPYQYASNNPVSNIDLDGLEGVNFNSSGTPILMMHQYFARTFPNATAAIQKIGGGLLTATVGTTAVIASPSTFGTSTGLGLAGMASGFSSMAVGTGDLIQAFKGKSETDVFQKTGQAFGLTELQVNLLDLALAGVTGSDAVTKMSAGMKSGDLLQTLDAMNSIKDVSEATMKSIQSLKSEINKQLEEKKKQEEEKKKQEQVEEKKNEN